jgi:predicted transcriptional regulator
VRVWVRALLALLLLDIFLFKGITIMTALTIRLPDDKYRRLKEVANQRGTSINRLIDKMTTLLLSDMDTETRFLIRAERGRGKVERGLELLEKGLSE